MGVYRLIFYVTQTHTHTHTPVHSIQSNQPACFGIIERVCNTKYTSDSDDVGKVSSPQGLLFCFFVMKMSGMTTNAAVLTQNIIAP